MCAFRHVTSRLRIILWRFMHKCDLMPCKFRDKMFMLSITMQFLWSQTSHCLSVEPRMPLQILVFTLKSLQYLQVTLGPPVEISSEVFLGFWGFYFQTKHWGQNSPTLRNPKHGPDFCRLSALKLRKPQCMDTKYCQLRAHLQDPLSFLTLLNSMTEIRTTGSLFGFKCNLLCNCCSVNEFTWDTTIQNFNCTLKSVLQISVMLLLV